MKGIMYSCAAYYSNYSCYSKMEMSLESYLDFEAAKAFSVQSSRLVPHLELMPTELPSIEVVKGILLCHGLAHKAETLLLYRLGTPSEDGSSCI